MGTFKARIISAQSWLEEGRLWSNPPAGSYDYWLRYATRHLFAAQFGEWMYKDANSIPDFAKDAYDRDFWRRSVDPFPVPGSPGKYAIAPDNSPGKYIDALELKPGKDPAAAIAAIINSPGAWRIDCDHAVQIANLFALSKTLGPAAFAARLGPSVFLRKRESSGLVTTNHYGRLRPVDKFGLVDEFLHHAQPPKPHMVKSADGTQWVPDPAWTQPDWEMPPPIVPFGQPEPPDYRLTIDFRFQQAQPQPSQSQGPPGLPTVDDDEDTLIARAPIGSRVRFTDMKAPIDNAFRHENCVKVAPNLYAAMGLPGITANPLTWWSLINMKFNEFPKKGVLDEMKTVRVFVDEVESFERR